MRSCAREPVGTQIAQKFSGAARFRTKGGRFVLAKDPIDTSSVKLLLAGWYYKHAKARFQQSLADALSKFKSYQLEMPPMVIRRMPKRWGSCTPGGKIILNPEIIKAPGRCIDYVVTHELCHLVYPNHGRAFQGIAEEGDARMAEMEIEVGESAVVKIRNQVKLRFFG